MIAGRYELGQEIGRGGMGSVYLAHDTVLGRDVAVKQIGMMPGGTSPDFERAEREAHLAARVNHQNVVAVFDLVSDDEKQWLVMEHVDGPTLAALVAERGALSPADLAPLVEQVAGALSAAHEAGIVHRDVKPSNILLNGDGVAKLSDFGVARAHADASLTQTGLVTGSPAYLAPEVATGRTATAASDVWSLGATLFHALTGKAPYAVGDNVLGAMYRIVHEEPPRLDAGNPLEPVVTAMMQREPEDRPSMLQVASMVSAADVSAATAGAHAAPTQAMDLEATQGFAAMDDPTPTPTSAFRPLAAPVAAPAATAVAPAAPATTSHARREQKPAGSNGRLLAAGAAVAVVGVVGLALLIGTGGDDDLTRAPNTAATSEQTPSPAAEEEPVTDDEGEVTAEQLEGFATDYLTAASNDAEAGYAMLTPAYQEESGGFEGYDGFWGRVSNVDVESVSGDPEALTVSYIYSYDFDDGERRTESVQLDLEEAGDGFLISGASAG